MGRPSASHIDARYGSSIGACVACPSAPLPATLGTCLRRPDAVWAPARLCLRRLDAAWAPASVLAAARAGPGLHLAATSVIEDGVCVCSQPPMPFVGDQGRCCACARVHCTALTLRAASMTKDARAAVTESLKRAICKGAAGGAKWCGRDEGKEGGKEEGRREG